MPIKRENSIFNALLKNYKYFCLLNMSTRKQIHKYKNITYVCKTLAGSMVLMLWMLVFLQVRLRQVWSLLNWLNRPKQNWLLKPANPISLPILRNHFLYPKILRIVLQNWKTAQMMIKNLVSLLIFYSLLLYSKLLKYRLYNLFIITRLSSNV